MNIKSSQNRGVVLVLLVLGVCALSAYAKPTQDDVFKSIQDNVNESDGGSNAKIVPWLCAGAGVVIVLAIFSRRQTRVSAPKAVNNPSRLLRDIMKTLPLKPRELKQLRVLAEETRLADGQPITSPLVLLLCPSIAVKAVQERTTRADRKTLAQVLRKLGYRS